MDKEAFQVLMKSLYADTFTVEYAGAKYVFQKRYSAETTMKMKDVPKREQSPYLVSTLLKDPEMSVQQVALMPNDFVNMCVLAINNQSELSGEDQAAIRAAASQT